MRCENTNLLRTMKLINADTTISSPKTKRFMPQPATPLTYIIFARTPRLGEGKTRLAATLGQETALHLYEAMLIDTLRGIAVRNAAQILLFTYPPESVNEMAAWCMKHDIKPPSMQILPQIGTNLGNQMFLAFMYAQVEGSFPAIILGTDSPTLTHNIWQMAEDALLHETQMGLQNLDKTFFLGSDYSNESVFERTLTALQQHHAHIKLLPEWTDIDDEETLWKVVAEAQENKQQHGAEYELVKRAEQIRRKY
jgi:uncharacterized protein